MFHWRELMFSETLPLNHELKLCKLMHLHTVNRTCLGYGNCLSFNTEKFHPQNGMWSSTMQYKYSLFHKCSKIAMSI